MIENFISIADGPSSFRRQRRNLELEQEELWTELSSRRSRFFGEQEVARVTRGTSEVVARGRQHDKRGQKRAKQMSVNNRLRPAARRSTPWFASALVPVPLFH